MSEENKMNTKIYADQASYTWGKEKIIEFTYENFAKGDVDYFGLRKYYRGGLCEKVTEVYDEFKQRLRKENKQIVDEQQVVFDNLVSFGNPVFPYVDTVKEKYNTKQFKQTHPSNVNELVSKPFGKLYKLIDNEIYVFNLDELESFFGVQGSEFDREKIIKRHPSNFDRGDKVFLKAVYTKNHNGSDGFSSKAERTKEINARGHQHFIMRDQDLAHKKFLAINPAYAEHDKALRAEKRKELKEQKLSLVESA